MLLTMRSRLEQELELSEFSSTSRLPVCRACSGPVRAKLRKVKYWDIIGARGVERREAEAWGRWKKKAK